jgi:predicted outer membrane protein
MKRQIAVGRATLSVFLLASVFNNIEARGADPRTVKTITADESIQTKQLRALADGGNSIDDKLFVLWEYAGALRERELAKVVLSRSDDPEVKALAILVRDGHQAGMDAMVPIASELGIALPEGPTAIEYAAIEAAGALKTADLERFFLRRQRAMHAWDITVFNDFGAVAKNDRLKRYVAGTRKPLRDHAETVVRLANKKGIPGGLTTIQTDAR